MGMHFGCRPGTAKDKMCLPCIEKWYAVRRPRLSFWQKLKIWFGKGGV
jgi:hypothetical protein